MTAICTGRLFMARDFTKMLRHKEETGGIVTRRIHPSLGVVYEVTYLVWGPQEAPKPTLKLWK